MSKTSILIVSSYLPPEQSGSGYHAYQFANFLFNSGYTTRLLSFNRNLKFKKNKKDKLITRIPYLNSGIFLKIISLPIIILYYFLYCAKFNTIVLYGNQIIAYQFIIIIARIFKHKIIFQSLLPGVDDFDTILKRKNNLNKKFNQWLFNSISVYFAISSLFSDIFQANSLKKIVLFKSTQGVDTNFFKPVSKDEKRSLLKKMRISGAKFIILAPGLLIKRKGYESLFKTLAKSKLNYLLLVTGENSPEQSILPKREKEEMIYLKKLGISLLQENILFTGPVDNINEYMQIADIMILNSSNEGMPNVILEGLASGLPLLCRNLRGITDYILQHEKNSLIFKDNNELNKQISFMMENKKERERIGKNARNFAIQHLSFEKVTNDLIDCINKNS